jgi:hypothetical protein
VAVHVRSMNLTAFIHIAVKLKDKQWSGKVTRCTRPRYGRRVLKIDRQEVGQFTVLAIRIFQLCD